MKKFIFNFVTFVLLFFTILGHNVSTASAQKIICKIEEDKYAGEIFLFSYNNANKNEGYVWVQTFIERDLSNDDRQFLNQINGQEIPEEDIRYNQILSLTNELRELDYNPLTSIVPTRIMEINNAVWGILRSFFNKQFA